MEFEQLGVSGKKDMSAEERLLLEIQQLFNGATEENLRRKA